MLQKMGSAIIFFGLISASSVNPDADRCCFTMGGLKNEKSEKIKLRGMDLTSNITSDATVTPFKVFETSVTGAFVMKDG